MPDVLIIGATERDVDLRHAIPVAITDPFAYAEVGGAKHVWIWAFEIDRIREAGVEAEFHPAEELRIEEVARQGADTYTLRRELWLRAVRALRLERATVPDTFPIGIADHLRANGIDLKVDQQLFDDRRRAKTPHEVAGVKRAQRAAEVGMSTWLELARAAERRNGGLYLDGEPLTCERVREHIVRATTALECSAESFIVSHGSQTAVGHDAGSGPIAADDVVLLDLFPRDHASGCFADMTRTFVVGSVPDEIYQYHRLAKEALDLCVETIRPGLTGKELHTKVCEFFEGHGQPTQLSKPDGEVLRDGYYHSTGHGVGLEVHEQPNIGRIGEPFVVGDVLAIEPGLYRHGVGGVRLEDLVLVTEDGCEVLTEFPYEMEIT